MIQHFTLTVTVHPSAAEPSEPTYTLMAICEERNEKWTAGPLTENEYRKALSGSQVNQVQTEAPVHTGKQLLFKAADGNALLFLEDELRKMKLQKLSSQQVKSEH